MDFSFCRLVELYCGEEGFFLMVAIKIFSTIFGSMIGSFLNALIYRIPIRKSIADGRSKCPGCDKMISWYENLPILSYVVLLGKCSKCKWKIPISYLLVELSVAIFAFFVSPTSLEVGDLLSYAFKLSVYSCFVVIFVIDLRHKIIPNKVNLFLAIVFILAVVTTKPYLYWIIGGAIGVLFPLGVTYLFYLIKGQIGLGGGDIKFWGALGLYLGPEGIIQNISYSCLIGSVFAGVLMIMKVVDKKTPIPFGPFIVIISFFQIFTPELITNFTNWFAGLI